VLRGHRRQARGSADRGLATDTRDLAERGLADAIIVSGDRTGAETRTSDIDEVRSVTRLPLLIGSGATPDNVHKVLPQVDGVIVGTYFKKDGIGNNSVEATRVQAFVERYRSLVRG
jgi:predicted TIM-barrel enzyme